MIFARLFQIRNKENKADQILPTIYSYADSVVWNVKEYVSLCVARVCVYVCKTWNTRVNFQPYFEKNK